MELCNVSNITIILKVWKNSFFTNINMFSISQIPFSSLNQRIQCRFSTMIKSVGFFLHTGWVFSKISVGFFLAGWFFFPKYCWVFFPEHGWVFSRTRLAFFQNRLGG